MSVVGLVLCNPFMAKIFLNNPIDNLRFKEKDIKENCKIFFTGLLESGTTFQYLIKEMWSGASMKYAKIKKKMPSKNQENEK